MAETPGRRVSDMTVLREDRPTINREIAFTGQRVKQKITFGLTLSLIIPLLVLAYGFCAYVLPLTWFFTVALTMRFSCVQPVYCGVMAPIVSRLAQGS